MGQAAAGGGGPGDGEMGGGAGAQSKVEGSWGGDRPTVRRCGEATGRAEEAELPEVDGVMARWI
jgi:hypothetical protein